MQPATNNVTEVNLSALLMWLCKLLWLCTKYSQLFCGICVILFCGYEIHKLLLCMAYFTLLTNVTIILNRRKLLQEYHITGRYSQSQYVAVNKRKYKKKSIMRSRTFLDEIQFPTTFIWSFFSWDACFQRRWVLNIMYSAISLHYISTILIFWAPCLHLGGR